MSKIAIGFPKLAKYIGQDATSYFPRYFNDWAMTRIDYKKGDLFVIANSIYSDYQQVLCYYVVPIAALENKLIPMSAITNWSSSYKKLPKIRANRFIVLDKAWIDGKRAAEINSTI